MINEQIEKIDKLNRLYYAEIKLNSLYSIKVYDKKYARKIIEAFPDKSNDDALYNCRREVCDFYKKSVSNYLDALREYMSIRKETERIINSVEDDELCSILRYRYIEHMTWEKISEKMYYSLRNVKYKHKNALDKIKN